MKKSSFGVSVLGSLAALSVLAMGGCASKQEAEDPAVAIPGVILFTDGEGGDGKSLIAGEDELRGGWYSYDGTEDCGLAQTGGKETGDINPPSSMFTFSPFSGVPALPPEGAQAGNTKAVHFYAVKEHDASPSGGAGVHLKDSTFFSVAKYSGIRFRAYSAISKDVFVKLTDNISEPAGAICERNIFPACDNAKLKTANKAQGCFDAAGVTVTVGPEWKEYRIYFSKKPANPSTGNVVTAGPMARGGWGLKQDGTATMEPLQVDKIDQFQVQSSDVAPIDMWMDNIGFIVTGGELDIP